MANSQNMFVANGAFKGLNYLNGAKIAPDVNKKTGEQLVGASGETKGYTLATGGRVYLTDAQVEIKE